MKVSGTRTADRVESFVSAIDHYEPTLLGDHEDAFRVFARFISRNVDGRYLDRHPPHELLPDIEYMMASTMTRHPGELRVRIKITDDTAGRRGVLVTCMPDQRFIYSVVRLCLEHLGLRCYRTINSVMPVSRSATGNISAVGLTDAPRESFIWIEVEADNLQERVSEIEEYVRGRLAASQVAVEDYNKLHTAIGALANRFEQMAKTRPDHRMLYEDNARLLRWMLADHFVFLGMKYLHGEGPLSPDPVGDFGIGRLNDWRGIQIENAERDVQEAGGIAPFLWVRKSRTESWIYRSGRSDHMLVQCFDDDGRAAGLVVVEGLFSFPALAEARTSVPMLDRVIGDLYAQMQATKGSHRYRTIRNAFNSLPLEYLFTLQSEDVRRLVEQVLEVDAEQRIQVHITADELQNTAFVFVALPRSHYSDELRADILRLLKERFRASSVDSGVYAGNADQVTFHYFLTGSSALDEQVATQLKAEIEHLASPWSDRLYDELQQRHGVKDARHLHSLYSEAFPARYREETSVARAIADIDVLETLASDDPHDAHFDCDLYREKADVALGITRLRLFQTDELLLSDILPILDNFGLVVIDQFPTTVQVPGRTEQVIATFRISGVQNMDIDLLSRRNRLRDGIRAVVLGAMPNDPLNRLLLRADIPWNYCVLVRAYLHYARQIGLPYGAATVQEALLGHGAIVRSLTELFRAKFDPEIEGQSATDVDEKRLALVDRTRRALLVQLDGVDDLTSDQVLRTFYNLIDATMRTNFYARNPLRVHHLVLKFDPSQITRMPEPRPYREIYVNHPLVEGLHLRGGPVARGGIRWSDRLLDYRTEVLGLMATQNLKNVLIVPRGAKGAFVLRHPPADFSERRAYADEMYKIFISGLLDVTDNLVDGKVVTPTAVLSYDGKDPYLVVAADKGTAHLSDTANKLAAARHFWLGDAFASGGSKGYDHKKEAITARGAWACVRRHFREMNLDPEIDQICAVGIGDMSGDVFGNGMLRSATMKVQAAFDHRHIFIDPNPDPAASFKERQRLFAMPRSSWDDYSKDKISPGGGVYPRGAKAIKLSPEAMEVLGITQDTLSGPELVQAILRAPVDLLWNGGIGTYIKASTETHLDAGDTTNDIVRVDGTEVRAKVIGEGGNLGITQAGRVELASRGIRLNTDAVDNSAGVDLSDHEVNLKILFQRAKTTKGISEDKRDEWLEKLRVEIGDAVVHNNWVQSRMLSLDELRSKRDGTRFLRAMQMLSDRVPFKRRESQLPGERIMRQRMQKNEGLYRPELAILCANAKLDLKQELNLAPSFDVARLRQELVDYFPQSLLKHFEDDVLNHPLGLDVARTILTNGIIGDAGSTWLVETSLMTGRNTAEILDAYLQASQLLGAPELKRQITQLESTMPTALEYQVRLRLEDAIDEVCQWLLRQPGAATAVFRKTFAAAFAARLAQNSTSDDLRTALQANPATKSLGDVCAVLAHIGELLDVALLAADSSEEVSRASSAFYLLGTGSGLLPLIRGALDGAGVEDLDRPARMALREQLRGQLVSLSATVLKREENVAQVSDKTRSWLDALQKELLPLATAPVALCNLVIAVDRTLRSSKTLSTSAK